jgi:monoamine oxidase
MIDYLAADCRRHGATIQFGAEVTKIDATGPPLVLHRADGERHHADLAVITVPPPILGAIEFTPTLPEKMAALAEIGYGDVIKILLRFDSQWWLTGRGENLSRVSFMFSDEGVPTFWTQYPEAHPVLTGWLAGPRAAKLLDRSEAELIDLSLNSLANMFGLAAEAVKEKLRAARALHWGKDKFARGAYSYATPETRAAQAVLSKPAGGIYFSGEALYQGRDMGTVEAALAIGRDTAHVILASAGR